jgi:hypothetical protein
VRAPLVIGQTQALAFLDQRWQDLLPPFVPIY